MMLEYLPAHDLIQLLAPSLNEASAISIYSRSNQFIACHMLPW